MKIALISFEYPPDTPNGGIATYTHQSARMLRSRGHHVEVFASSAYRSGTAYEDQIKVNRVKEDNAQAFRKRISGVFADRHADVGFDVVEGPEYNADALDAIRLVPDIPLVVKLHTPTFLTYALSIPSMPALKKLRSSIGSLLRGRKPWWYFTQESIFERNHVLDADAIVTPSIDLGKKLIQHWGLDLKMISHVPNPYQPPEEILRVPVNTTTNTVTYIGRLEARKGVLDLVQSIPFILRSCPNTKFRFVGRPLSSPEEGLNMQEYIEKLIIDFKKSIEFVGHVPNDCIASVFASTDICVFPSLWENFPYVCLEAMAAARGVIGSRSGGMADMLGREAGLLVPPRSPKRIARAVVDLLEQPNLRKELGIAARKRVLSSYNWDHISVLQENVYLRAIKRRRELGPRSSFDRGYA